MASPHRIFAVVGLTVGVASLAYSIREERRMAEYHKKLRKSALNGLSKGKDLSIYNQKQLLIGAMHELEHTKDAAVAMRIAADHLEEQRREGKPQDYYERIRKAGL